MKFSFHEYKEKRQISDLEDKFNKLCEAIVASGVDFDDFWKNTALPVLLESSKFEDEESLLVEIGSPFGNPINGQFASAPSFVNPNTFNPQIPPVRTQAPTMNPNRDVLKQKKLEAFQKKVNQQISLIKQRFQIAMKDFLTAVTNDARSQSDPHMWKIAQSFYNKIITASKPVVDSFTMQARFGKSGYVDQFKQQSSQQ